MNIQTVLKLSRPRFWIYLIGPYLIALAAAGVRPDLLVILFGLYLSLPANLLIYGINDIFDHETDKLNPKKQNYEELLEQKSASRLVWLISLLNVPFLILFFLNLPLAASLWLVVFLITGIGYSAPPIRAKAKPILDSIFNILYVAPGFAIYSAVSGQTPPLAAIVAATLWCMAMHAYSAVPDIAADKASQTPTIATLFGKPVTLLLCGLAYGLAAVITTGLLGWIALIGGVVYLGLIGLSLRTRQNSELFRLYRLFPYVNTLLGAGLFFAVIY